MQAGTNLFSFSNIKSENMFKISDYNSFNYDFSNNELNEAENINIFKQKKKYEGHYTNKINVSFPSNDKLRDFSFRNKFFINYENSFANFCGITIKMFSDINVKKEYIPKINQMGDINVSIENIIENLDIFSDLINRKIRRFKGNRKKRKLIDNQIRKKFTISKISFHKKGN